MKDSKSVLIGVTGGVAVYKACDVVRELKRQGFRVRVAMTPAAQTFVSAMTFEALSGAPVGTDLLPGCTDGQIDHIRLGRECDVVAVIPATANFLARLHAGLSDDLVSATVLALPKKTPVLLVPAMNQEMWNHPSTRRNVAAIRSWDTVRYRILEPVEKEMACGETGQGGLPEPVEIAREVGNLIG